MRLPERLVGRKRLIIRSGTGNPLMPFLRSRTLSNMRLQNSSNIYQQNRECNRMSDSAMSSLSKRLITVNPTYLDADLLPAFFLRCKDTNIFPLRKPFLKKHFSFWSCSSLKKDQQGPIHIGFFLFYLFRFSQKRRMDMLGRRRAFDDGRIPTDVLGVLETIKDNNAGLESAGEKKWKK